MAIVTNDVKSDSFARVWVNNRGVFYTRNRKKKTEKESWITLVSRLIDRRMRLWIFSYGRKRVSCAIKNPFIGMHSPFWFHWQIGCTEKSEIRPKVNDSIAKQLTEARKIAISISDERFKVMWNSWGVQVQNSSEKVSRHAFMPAEIHCYNTSTCTQCIFTSWLMIPDVPETTILVRTILTAVTVKWQMISRLRDNCGLWLQGSPNLKIDRLFWAKPPS